MAFPDDDPDDWGEPLDGDTPDDETTDDWWDHPSLTTAERNPSLR